MAKSKAKPVARAKTAKPSAKPKTVARAAVRKPPAKAAPQPKAAAKVAAKPAAKKAPPKPVAKAVAKPAAAAKPAAKKPAAKPAPAPKPAAKPNPPKALAAAAANPPKAAPAPAAKPTGANSNALQNSGNFVTTSKPETSAAAKGTKARATPPPMDNGVTMQDGRYALPTTVTIDLPNAYKPSSKDKDEYMGPRHLQYFRNKLSKWREELVEESRQTIESLRDEVRDVGDEAERATRETENSLELRTRDRYRKLIAKIDKALKRIEEGRYGFCEETDEEIGLDRLEARPIATLSLDAQERWEHRQKQMGD